MLENKLKGSSTSSKLSGAHVIYLKSLSLSLFGDRYSLLQLLVLVGGQLVLGPTLRTNAGIVVTVRTRVKGSRQRNKNWEVKWCEVGEWAQRLTQTSDFISPVPAEYRQVLFCYLLYKLSSTFPLGNFQVGKGERATGSFLTWLWECDSLGAVFYKC